MPNLDSNQSDHQPSDLLPNLDSNQPDHQPSGLCSQCRLKSTWSSAWWHVYPIQTQISLAISIVACVSSADFSQPGHQHGDMYAQFKLKSAWPSA